mmetsp:Transcript_13878/g.40915  ORF Transcript_13878/g.40915 Transcript_13878/m.40915 type:complete len:225 (+) Transcript_13878:632-1306(+)
MPTSKSGASPLGRFPSPPPTVSAAPAPDASAAAPLRCPFGVSSKSARSSLSEDMISPCAVARIMLSTRRRKARMRSQTARSCACCRKERLTPPSAAGAGSLALAPAMDGDDGAASPSPLPLDSSKRTRALAHAAAAACRTASKKPSSRSHAPSRCSACAARKLASPYASPLSIRCNRREDASTHSRRTRPSGGPKTGSSGSSRASIAPRQALRFLRTMPLRQPR